MAVGEPDYFFCSFYNLFSGRWSSLGSPCLHSLGWAKPAHLRGFLFSCDPFHNMDCLSELLQSPTGHLNVLCSYPHNWRHPKFLKVTAYCLLNLDPNLKISIQSVETPQCLNNLYNVLYLPPLQYLQNQFSAMKYAMSVL